MHLHGQLEEKDTKVSKNKVLTIDMPFSDEEAGGVYVPCIDI
jgi:hypothetical protein